MQNNTSSSSKQQSCGQRYRGIINKLRNYHFFICQICFKQTNRSQVQAFAQCVHQDFCKECLTSYVKIKLGKDEQIICPVDGCEAPINEMTNFWNEIAVEIKDKYNLFKAALLKQRQLKFIKCPSSACSGNIVYQRNVYKCKVCYQQFCLNCMEKVHLGNCDFQDIAWLQTKMKLRRCPKCKYVFQYLNGCYKVTCLCKYCFCLYCNASATRQQAHLCQYNRQNRLIFQKPIFKKDKRIFKSINNSSQIHFYAQPTTCYLATLSVIFNIVFLIPYLLLLGLLFIGKMILPTITLVLKLIGIVLTLTVIGFGPFTLQLFNNCNDWAKYISLLLLPITIIVGIYSSFKELFSTLVKLAVDAYKKTAKNVAKQLFMKG